MATAESERVSLALDPSGTWISNLSGRDKETLLLGLLKELMREHGEGAPIAIETNGGQYGYYVPQSASRELQESRMPTVTVDEATLERLRKRAANSDFVDEAGFSAAFRKTLGLTDSET